jgi:death-on-curing protein
VDKLTHLFFCACEFHCFQDGNKRIAITLSAQFLLFNGYMAVAKDFFSNMENISYHVAAGKIDKELLHRILTAILEGTYSSDEALKLEIFNAISG